MQRLTGHLRASGALKSPEIIQAFLNVDRKYFVPDKYQRFTYNDEALPIGYGQTISQPYTVAFMLELLRPQAGDKVIDIGSGSGWTTALLANLGGSIGEVIGLEIIPELVELGQKNLKHFRCRWARIKQASPELGLPVSAPFDRILVSASAETLPQALINQLKIGGALVMPVGNSIFRVTKGKDKNRIEEYPGFVFVPLVT